MQTTQVKQTRLQQATQLLAEVVATENAYVAELNVNKNFTIAEIRTIESNDVIIMHEKLKKVRKLLKSVISDLELNNDELADAACEKAKAKAKK